MSSRVTRGSGVLEGYLSRRRAAIAKRLLRDVPRSGRILDVGCGTYPLFLVDCGFQDRHGIDQVIEEDSVFEGIRLTPYSIGSGEPLPYPDDHFHAATMLAVFEHIDPPDLEPLLTETRRVLQPGGRLVITTPAAWTDPLLRILARLGAVSAEEVDEHKGAYSRADLRQYLERAGFAPENTDVASFELGANLWATAAA